MVEDLGNDRAVGAIEIGTVDPIFEFFHQIVFVGWIFFWDEFLVLFIGLLSTRVNSMKNFRPLFDFSLLFLVFLVLIDFDVLDLAKFIIKLEITVVLILGHELLVFLQLFIFFDLNKQLFDLVLHHTLNPSLHGFLHEAFLLVFELFDYAQSNRLPVIVSRPILRSSRRRLQRW